MILRQSKAQTSLELIVYVSIMLFMVVVSSFVAIGTSNDIFIENVNRDARKVAVTVAMEINTAVDVGPDYSSTFLLPGALHGGTDYSVQVMGQSVYVFWNNRSYSVPLLTYNISGTPSKGLNIIRNNNGAITLG